MKKSNKNKLNYQRGELTALKNKIGKLKEAVELKKKTENYLNKIDNITDQASTRIQEMNSIQSELNTIFNSSKEQSQEINSTLNTIVEMKNQADQNRNDIISLKDLTQTQVNTTKENIDKTESTRKIVEELKEEVSRQLAVATSGTLAESFIRRSEQLQKSAVKWAWLTIGSSLVVALLGFLVVNQLIDHGWPDTIGGVVKISVTFPLLFLLFFSYKSYSFNRLFEEHYTFKYVVAFSLAAYQKLLVDSISKNYDQKVIEFITSSIKDIYRPPKELEQRLSKAEKNIVDKIIEKTINPIDKL